jgi:hypothetical protein
MVDQRVISQCSGNQNLFIGTIAESMMSLERDALWPRDYTGQLAKVVWHNRLLIRN